MELDGTVILFNDQAQGRAASGASFAAPGWAAM